MAKEERILVTAALPYANGPVHVGHTIGCYVPADVYTRYHRLKGTDVLYICGTDEHGTPITVTAEAEGVSPMDVVVKYHKTQEDAFRQLGVEFDNFSGTARDIHYEMSQGFFLNVLKKGYIEKETVERPYCPKCDRFLPDRYVKGTCPNCGAQDQRGDQCEACGKQLEPHELKDPYCDICHDTPEMRKTDHWFFDLGKVQGDLKDWIENDCKHWPANARNFALGWINEGLKPRAITRDLKWGVPVPEKDLEGKPIEGHEGKVLYVWFDAPIGYISSTMEWAKKSGKPNAWKKYWDKKSRQEGKLRIVHFIGKDNIPFHTIIWPGMLIAEGTYPLPWQIASNEFLNLEGQKMSTSRGWVIWLHDILNEFAPDAVRYYLLSIAPETSDSDFYLKEFQEKVNNELIATLGNFVNRTLTFISNKKKGIVPEPDIEYGSDNALVKTMRGGPKIVGELIEEFHLKASLSSLLNFARNGNVFFQEREPWKNDNGTTLFLCANLCRSLAILMYPFLPFSAERIWKMLGLTGSVADQSWESAGELGIEPGHKIGKVEVLYEKIEDEKIESFKDKYLSKVVKKVEVKPMVDISEFEKLDLRVGEIKSVEEHPNAKKLVVLKVDLGGAGQKQLVAGVKETYSNDELIGKQIIVVVNLRPAKIRGVLSEGMLLAALDDRKPVLVVPEKVVEVGSKIA